MYHFVEEEGIEATGSLAPLKFMNTFVKYITCAELFSVYLLWMRCDMIMVLAGIFGNSVDNNFNHWWACINMQMNFVAQMLNVARIY